MNTLWWEKKRHLRGQTRAAFLNALCVDILQEQDGFEETETNKVTGEKRNRRTVCMRKCVSRLTERLLTAQRLGSAVSKEPENELPSAREQPLASL